MTLAGRLVINKPINNRNSLSQQDLELSSDRLQGILLRHWVPVGTAEVAHQDDGLGSVVQAVLDAGNRSLDPENRRQSSQTGFLHPCCCLRERRFSPLVVGDELVLHRNVKVDPERQETGSAERKAQMKRGFVSLSQLSASSF